MLPSSNFVFVSNVIPMDQVVDLDGFFCRFRIQLETKVSLVPDLASDPILKQRPSISDQDSLNPDPVFFALS